MNIRRLALDVDKALAQPSVIELAQAISAVEGVEAANITVTEIDLQTVGMDLTVEGDHIDYDALEKAIVAAGAVVNSIDQIAFGERIVERAVRGR